jgi:protein CpxP
MNMNKRLVRGLALAGVLTMAAPVLVNAQSASPAAAEARADGAERQEAAQGQERRDRMHHHHHHERHHAEGMHGMHGMHAGHAGGPSLERLVHGLNLSEAQRDRLFELRHAQAPALREQGKVIREAYRELRTLSLSDAYDETKANEISDRGAKAAAEIARLRARAANEVWKLLTPEQREKLSQRVERHGKRGAAARQAQG